jgi:hypothetical protein
VRDRYADVELRIANERQAALIHERGEQNGRPDLGPATRAALLAALPDPQRYGQLLFERTFPERDALATCFRERLAIARENGARLRLRINVSPTAEPALQGLFWEMLFDPVENLALGRAREVVMSRTAVSTASRPMQSATLGQPKLLIAVAAPTDLSTYGLAPIAREPLVQALRGSLERVPYAAAFEVLEPPVTARRIFDKMTEGFHVLHLVAHGHVSDQDETARIVLEKDDGTADFVEDTAFGEIFEGGTTARLITLLACNSGVSVGSEQDPFRGLAAQIVKHGAPAVIAMTRPISVNAAAEFLRAFHDSLSRTPVIDAALNTARWHLHAASKMSLDWASPALFMRLPDGLLWDTPSHIVVHDGQTAGGLDTVFGQLRTALRERKLVPVLGPALTQHLLPSPAEITRLWCQQVPVRSSAYVLEGRNDLPRVAKLVQIRKTDPYMALMTLYRKRFLEMHGVSDEQYQGMTLTDVAQKFPLRPPNPDEDEPHVLLARMPIRNYLTTNYDPFMSIALERTPLGATGGIFRKPRRERCRWHETDEPPDHSSGYDSAGTYEEPLVFHLFGEDRAWSSLVLTEDDYLDYLRNVNWSSDEKPWRIPLQLRSELTESMLLFLGFRAFDLSFRVLFKAVILNLQRVRQDSRYAVLQMDPGESPEQERRELQQFLNNDLLNWKVNVVWGSVQEFLSTLAHAPVAV